MIEGLKLILEELTSLNMRIESIEGSLQNINIVLGEWHHDFQGREERRAEEVQRLRERVSKLEIGTPIEDPRTERP